MREFIYYSGKARTSGNFDTSELMQAGRMDIVCNVIISALFLSHKMREDVHLHLIFMGQPTPPRHLEFVSNKEIPISKKDVASLIKVMLYKCREGERREIFPGCFVEKKSFQQVMNDLEAEGKKVLILDKKGKDIYEGDIVKDLKLPANTINYNVKKLVDAGLIEISKNYFWSVKGKKIPQYRVSRKMIVISPKSSFSSNKSLLAAFLATGIVAFGIKLYTQMYEKSASLTNSAGEKFASGASGVANSVMPSNGDAGIVSIVPNTIPSAVQNVNIPEIWLWFFLGGITALLIYTIINWRKL